MTIEDCVAGHVMSADMAAYLSAAVRSRLNILICGGTGAGKTTLLNMLSTFIGDRERLLPISDAAALQLRQSNALRLETRQPTVDGRSEARRVGKEGGRTCSSRRSAIQ